MKKILLSLLATLLVSITGTAQAQEYFADGYTFTYGVAKQDSLYSIVATVKSNCMVFLKAMKGLILRRYVLDTGVLQNTLKL